MKKIKKRKFFLVGIVAIIYVIAIIAICRCVGTDSDKANHLLQAYDILNGNVFLKDWNLTGVTFLTTDLLYYEIAELFFGISYKSIYVAGGLMISSVLMISFIAADYGQEEHKILKKILCVLLLAIPCKELVSHFRVHTGAVFLSIFSYIVYYCIVKEKKYLRRYFISLFIVLFMGTIGDLLLVIIAAIPIVLCCLYRLAQVEKKDGYIYLKIAIISIGAVLGGFVFQKLYLWIGKANLNSYIGNQNFATVDQWPIKFQNFIVSILNMTMANFGGGRIADIWNLLKGVYFLVLLMAVIFMIISINNFLKNEEEDCLSTLLALGIIMAFLAYLLTDMAQPRYITLIPIASILLVVRNVQWLYEKFNNRKMISTIVISIAVLGAIGKMHEVLTYEYPTINKSYAEIIEFLEEHNLKYGYASFWNASNLTVLSENNVKVRHITKNGPTYEMYNWFNKNSWYHEDTTFVLVNNSSKDLGAMDPFGVSEEGIIQVFGNPSECYEINDYIVMVYEKKLSDALSDGKL